MFGVPAAASTGARRRLPERRIQPSGTWGVWIDARLQAKVWTQKEAFDQLRERWPELFPWGDTSIDSFRAYIRGRVPDEAQQAAFVELFGGPAPAAGSDTRDTRTFDPADLASALVAQAASMARMLQFAIARDQSVEARIRLLEGEVRTLREQLGVEGPPGQSTPPRTEGSAG